MKILQFFIIKELAVGSDDSYLHMIIAICVSINQVNATERRNNTLTVDQDNDLTT
jgi:hypothetical protein